MRHQQLTEIIREKLRQGGRHKGGAILGQRPRGKPPHEFWSDRFFR